MEKDNGDMKTDSAYYLVNSSILPEVFNKVMQVKEILSHNPELTVNDAAKEIGISRSAYYKYKDYIFPFYETSRGRVLTLVFVVEDFSGILSNIIGKIAKAKANILTITQNIPINRLADVTISIETAGMEQDIKEMLDEINGINGVRSYKIVRRE